MNPLEVFRQADWVESKNRFVFWSGGVDSTVALHLALRVWRDPSPQVVFVDTGISLPETLEYVYCMAEKWHLNLTVLKPEIDFWDYVKSAGFPKVNALWCRRLLKMKPIREFLKSRHGWKVQVLGIRRAESTARKKLWYYQRPFHRHTKLPFTYELLPILEWTDSQVMEYMRRHQIPINPAYKLYGSSGCYFCPFVEKPRHYLTLKRLHPSLFQKIFEAETVMRKGGTPWPRKSIVPLTEQTSLNVFEKN